MRLPDLPPIELGVIQCGAAALHPTRPISLDITVDESGRLYVISDPTLGLHVYAYSRVGDTHAELLEEVEDHLRFLWTRYAKAPREELAPDAIALAERLRAAFREQP